MAHKIDAQEDIRQSFAKNLRRLMYADNLTQKDLCDRLNVSAPTVSAWCNGNKMPRVETIDALCDLFKVERSELLSDNSREYKPQKDNFVKPPERIQPVRMPKEKSITFTMEDIELATRIAAADEQTKRLIKYLLAFNETKNAADE